MDFIISDFTREPVNVGLFETELVEAFTATVTFVGGDVLFISQLPTDKGFWVADAAFRANGMPVWSHGKGERTTLSRTTSEIPELTKALDELRDAL